jgi:hypothetical protein
VNVTHVHVDCDDERVAGISVAERPSRSEISHELEIGSTRETVFGVGTRWRDREIADRERDRFRNAFVRWTQAREACAGFGTLIEEAG